jgi:hypothetical protein
MKRILLAVILLLPGCTVTGRLSWEHVRGPDRAFAAVELHPGDGR